MRILIGWKDAIFEAGKNSGNGFQASSAGKNAVYKNARGGDPVVSGRRES